MKSLLKKIAIPLYLKAIKIYTLHIKKYEYNPDNYIGCFLVDTPKTYNVVLNKADEVIYVFWTGDNKLTENRKIGLQSLIEISGVTVILITPKNLKEYILIEHQLHEGFEYLSLIQKSDYLRCYFMLHYGGGYSDIKFCLKSWKFLFTKLNKENDKWVLGIRERYAASTPVIDGNIGKDLKKYYNNVISNGAFIYKKNSPICKEWMDEIHNRLDFFLEDLKKNPGGIYDEDNYPIPWAYLAGHIMHPLILKYSEKAIYNDEDLFSIKNYR